MIDAMDRYKLLQKMAVPKLAQPQATSPVQFGQKVTPMHNPAKQNGDVFIKSTKPVEASAKADASTKTTASTKTPNPMGAALQGFVKQVSKSENPLFGALKKLVPASPMAQTEPARKTLATPALQPAGNSPFLKAGEQKVSTPERTAPMQPTSAQANMKNKVTLFAGAAVTSTALSALTAAVAGPAALTSPTLLNKIVSLLPTQLP